MKRGACYKVSLLVALLVGTAAGQTFTPLAYFTNETALERSHL